MITIIKKKIKDVRVYDVRLLSTDEKPASGIPNGSTCIEIDTGSKFLFDESTHTWKEMSGSAIISAEGVEF